MNVQTVARGLITVISLCVLLVGGSAAFATRAARGAAAVSGASTQTQRRLIGSYRLVTHIETPGRIVAPGALSIDTYNRSRVRSPGTAPMQTRSRPNR